LPADGTRPARQNTLASLVPDAPQSVERRISPPSMTACSPPFGLATKRGYQHLDKLREPADMASWLATVARRESLRLLQAPLREVLSDDPRLGDRAESDGPEAVLLAAERTAILARALATLPERHRRLMTLLASESELDYREISATLGIPVGSIGPIRARSLARLELHPELRGLCLGIG
jgi:RNA polymerase sigma factor (sigma-70 family)